MIRVKKVGTLFQLAVKTKMMTLRIFPYKNINGSGFLLYNEITVQLFLPITRNSNLIQMTQNAYKNSENLSPLGKMAVYVDKNELTFLRRPVMVVIVHLIHFASIDVLCC